MSDNNYPKVTSYNAIVEQDSSHFNAPSLPIEKALTEIATSLTSLTTWLTSGGLTQVLSGYARSNSVKDILGGLAAHDGRNALDARVLEQNATEIVHHVEAVFQKYEERLKALAKGNMDPNLHDGEEDFKKWKEEKSGN